MTPADVTKALANAADLVPFLKTANLATPSQMLRLRGQAADTIEALAAALTAQTAKAEAAEAREAALLATNETERKTLIRHNAAHAAQVADLTSKLEAMQVEMAWALPILRRHVTHPNDQGDLDDFEAALKTGGA